MHDYILAAITGFFLCMAGGVPTWMTVRARNQIQTTQQEGLDRLGTPNGKGTIAEMNEQQLEAHRDLALQVGVIERKVDATAQSLTEHLAFSASQVGRLDELEQGHASILSTIEQKSDAVQVTLAAQDATAEEIKHDIEAIQSEVTP